MSTNVSSSLLFAGYPDPAHRLLNCQSAPVTPQKNPFSIIILLTQIGNRAPCIRADTQATAARLPYDPLCRVAYQFLCLLIDLLDDMRFRIDSHYAGVKAIKQKVLQAFTVLQSPGRLLLRPSPLVQNDHSD